MQSWLQTSATGEEGKAGKAGPWPHPAVHAHHHVSVGRRHAHRPTVVLPGPAMCARDLLRPETPHHLLNIVETSKRMELENATIQTVAPEADGYMAAMALFLAGSKNRIVGACRRPWIMIRMPSLLAVAHDRGVRPSSAIAFQCAGETSLNQASSRGHAIFTLCLTRTPCDEGGTAYISKLHIVDLAGSERMKRTNTQGGFPAGGHAIMPAVQAPTHLTCLVRAEARHVHPNCRGPTERGNLHQSGAVHAAQGPAGEHSADCGLLCLWMHNVFNRNALNCWLLGDGCRT
jgi:hypothetical protein